MSMIDSLIEEHFSSLGDGVDLALVVSELDGDLFRVGKMVEAIEDYAALPLDSVDNETIIVMAQCLLSFLGRMGAHVDALERFADGKGPTLKDRFN